LIKTAIVGGGPAGAYCACCLAENDIHATIFDPTHPREKPCGGLVSPLAQKLFPFLRQIPIEHTVINKIYFVSPSGNRICLNLRDGFLGFSRLMLDKYLVDRAVEKGAELIEEEVIALKWKGDFWDLKTEKQTYIAKILIGADGVNSLVRRKLIGPLSRKDTGLCLGYFANALGDEDATIIFSPYRKGFIWVIPRGRNTCFGIGTAEISGSYRMKKELDLFIQKNYPNIKKFSSWAALTPNIKDPRIFSKPLAGTNWILIGDAAGHVNPISGEGILYALLDGELAAQAIAENSSKRFNKLWTETYRMNLFSAIKMRKWLYKKPVLELYCKTLRCLNMRASLNISLGVCTISFYVLCPNLFLWKHMSLSGFS
jgi:geranylgeranyl reductase family protein